MKPLYKRFLSVLLCLCMLFTLLPVTAVAADETQEPVSFDISDSESLFFNAAGGSGVALAADEEEVEFVTKDEAANLFYNAVKNKEDYVIIYTYDEFLDDTGKSIEDLVEDEIPWRLRNDIPRWVTVDMGFEAYYDYQYGIYAVAVVYYFYHLTTAEQDAYVAEAAAALSEELGLADLKDYELRRKVYDYMIQNYEYVPEDPEDTSDDILMTAYSALTTGKADSRGLAALFHLLTGDSIIAGTLNDNIHYWNAARVTGETVNSWDPFFYVDVACDVGTTDYEHFLRCPANMSDHGMTEYCGTPVYGGPIWAKYDYGVIWTVASGTCGKNIKWKLTSDAVLTITGKGDLKKVDNSYDFRQWGPDMDFIYIQEGITSLYDGIFKERDDNGRTVSAVSITYPDSIRRLSNETLPASVEKVYFEGDPPVLETELKEYTYEILYPFNNKTVEVYYPADRPSWNSVEGRNYGGNITWIPVSEEHTWGEWTILKDKTCTEDGLKTRSCSHCGETQEWIYAADGHLSHNQGSHRAATCTIGVHYVYGCEICKEKFYIETGSPKGHNWSKEVVTEATETEAAKRELTCSRCGVTIDMGFAETIRIFGDGRCETAIASADTLKQTLGIETFDSIILASGSGFADALAGSYLAAVKTAPILLYQKSRMQLNLDYITANLTVGGTVYILGGVSAVPADMEEALVAAGINVVRLYGNNRYTTNIEILKAAGISQDTPILVATGQNFADSLSASATGLPILLVNGKSKELTAEQKAFLEELTAEGQRELIILGGSGAVTDELMIRLRNYGTTERVYGNSRYATSVKIAERFFADPDTVLVAYGGNFPDGLSGGPLAYTLGAPLVLTQSGKEATATEYVAAGEFVKAYILGGTAAVSDKTVETIFG